MGSLGTVAFPNIENENKYEKRNFSFSDLKIIDNKEYVNIEIQGVNSNFIKKDYYIVPAHIETFLLPFGSKINNINVLPSDINSKILDKKIQVAPEPILLNGDLSQNDNKVSIEPLAINDWYSYRIGSGLISGSRCLILKVQLFPVQYNPEIDSINWASSFEIDVDYSTPNYQSNNFNDVYDLIILSPNEFINGLNSLVTHKNSMEISTKLISLNDIYNSVYFPSQGRDDQEKIKYFIKNAIEEWNTTFVLLVGGKDDFPMRMTNVYVDYGDGDDEVFVSDLYYADIYNETGAFASWDTNNNDNFGEYDWGSSNLNDEVDLYPDVYLGRLACSNSNQVTTAVNKIIYYETSEAYAEDWYSEIILVGGDTSPGDSSAIDEGEYVCDTIEGIMNGFSTNKLYATNGGITLLSTMSNAFNEGSGYLVMSGHGNPYSWATHPHENDNIWLPPPNGFRYDDVLDLENGEKLPIVLTDACSPFKYSVTNNCFGWSFISNPDGGGIAGFGCTALSWGTSGRSVIRYLTTKLMLDTFRAYKDDNAINLGEMWGMGISTFINSNMDGGDHKSIEEWQLLGDPSLAIADESLPPLKPGTPVGPDSGGINTEYTYSTSTTDPENDNVYYWFDWGDGENSGWLGPYDSGDSIETSYTWTTKGDFNVTVRSKDIHGSLSEWSDPLYFHFYSIF